MKKPPFKKKRALKKKKMKGRALQKQKKKKAPFILISLKNSKRGILVLFIG